MPEFSHQIKVFFYNISFLPFSIVPLQVYLLSLSLNWYMCVGGVFYRALKYLYNHLKGSYKLSQINAMRHPFSKLKGKKEWSFAKSMLVERRYAFFHIGVWLTTQLMRWTSSYLFKLYYFFSKDFSKRQHIALRIVLSLGIVIIEDTKYDKPVCTCWRHRLLSDQVLFMNNINTIHCTFKWFLIYNFLKTFSHVSRWTLECTCRCRVRQRKHKIARYQHTTTKGT